LQVLSYLHYGTLRGRDGESLHLAFVRFINRSDKKHNPLRLILCLQNEPLHFSEKQQRDEMKLHRHIMREKFFSKIASMHSSSQPSANYLRETRQFT
jgi:hypothetical protein